MLPSVRSCRSSRDAVVVAACLALFGATASAAQSAPQGPAVCPTSYTAQSLQDVLVRYAGYYTEEEIRAGFAGRDRNGNGTICAKPWQKDRLFPLQNVRDDNTGGP